MTRDFGLGLAATILVILLVATQSTDRIQKAGGGDGCPDGKYCTGASSAGKCRGKCVPEDLNHSPSIKAEHQTLLQHSIINL